MQNDAIDCRANKEKRNNELRFVGEYLDGFIVCRNWREWVLPFPKNHSIDSPASFVTDFTDTFREVTYCVNIYNMFNYFNQGDWLM